MEAMALTRTLFGGEPTKPDHTNVSAGGAGGAGGMEAGIAEWRVASVYFESWGLLSCALCPVAAQRPVLPLHCRRRCRRLQVATAVFSHPQIGTVGLGEEAAVAAYGDVDVYTSAFRPMRNTIRWGWGWGWGWGPVGWSGGWSVSGGGGKVS